MPIATPTWVSCRRWVLVTPWGQISYAWMSSSNLCQVLCCYSNYLSYCLKVSLTQKERNSFSFILGISSIQNVVQSPQVIKDASGAAMKIKQPSKQVKFLPSPSHTLQLQDCFFLCFICARFVWRKDLTDY